MYEHLGPTQFSRLIYGAMIGLAVIVALEHEDPDPAVMAGTLAGTGVAVGLTEALQRVPRNRGRDAPTGRPRAADARSRRTSRPRFSQPASPRDPFALAAAGAMDIDTAFEVAKWSGLPLTASYGLRGRTPPWRGMAGGALPGRRGGADRRAPYRVQGARPLRRQVGVAHAWIAPRRSPVRPRQPLGIEVVLQHAHGLLRFGEGRFDEALAEFTRAQGAERLLASLHVFTVDVRGRAGQVRVRMGDADSRWVRARRFEPGAARHAPACASRSRLWLSHRDASGAGRRGAGAGDRRLCPSALYERWARVEALLLDAAARDRLGDRGAAERSLEAGARPR